jgi:glucose/arabinose dehydrogenase
MRPPTSALLLLPIALCLVPARAAAFPSVPWPFVAEAVGPQDGFNTPTSFAYMPDGRILVSEKRGTVRVLKNGAVLGTSMWDGQTEVLDNGDRGLLCVAVDPNYATNHFIYLLYTVDPDADGNDSNDDAYGRLTRYATKSNNPDQVDPATRTVLFGATWDEGPASGSTTHTIGCLRWGTDGSLLVSSGEGAQWVNIDSGGRDPSMFLPGRIETRQDIGAFRAQYLGSMCGKILRLNPLTGAGYAGNPFASSDLHSVRSRVWSYGLRNPFRFCVMPGTGSADTSSANPGVLSIGDVGWETWEELDIATHAGQNFGWPCHEGLQDRADYESAIPLFDGCGTIGTPENPSPADPPSITWNHNDDALSTPPVFHGRAAIGGVFYQGDGYPQSYHGRLFFGDWDQSWIKTAVIGPGGNLIDLDDFGVDGGGPVDFHLDPLTGDVVMLSINDATLWRIRYTGTLAAPVGAAALSLSLAHPNPSRARVSLALELPRPTPVRFSVLDLVGRQVWSDGARFYGAGAWTLTWDGSTGRGARARPGVYWMRVEVDGKPLLRRAVLLQ